MTLRLTFLVLLLTSCTPTLPRLAPPPDVATRVPDGRLRMATLNAWLLPIAADDLSLRMRRIPGALASLDLDVVCLQEVWLGGYQTALERSMKGHFPHVVRSAGGLMLLSRYPVVHREFHAFPFVPGLMPTEWLAQKGALETIVEGPRGRVRIVTTHMALDFGGEQEARRSQLSILGRHIDRWTDLPLIVAGDFNVPPTWNDQLTPDYQALRRWGMLDTNPPRQREDGSYQVLPPTRLGWPPERRERILFQLAIDYILYRNPPGHPRPLRSHGQTLHMTAPHEALSDHHLLVAEFSM